MKIGTNKGRIRKKTQGGRRMTWEDKKRTRMRAYVISWKALIRKIKENPISLMKVTIKRVSYLAK